MEVYIQQLNGEHIDDWLFAAYLGFKKKGADIKFFEDVNTVPDHKGVVVVAYIEDSIKYMEKNGITVPTPLNIPDELNFPRYLQRTIEVKSMKDFRLNHKLPIFVKPHSRVKEFSSGVLTREDTLRIALHDVPEETMVMTSSVVNMVSEYRCFVYKGELKDIKHYQGDFRVFPDSHKVEAMVRMYKNAPIAYSLDVGVIQSYGQGDETVLVECNDMWSIGHYGLAIEDYSSMLRDRWFQIIRG